MKKVKNKKTGDIYETTMPVVFNIKTNGGGEHTVSCESITELNEEWEDYEEPKEYWTIDWTCLGVTTNKYSGDDVDDFNKVIGNYFETKEEAEKALEKLKAWKRLKDRNFHFLMYPALGCGELESILDFGDIDDEEEIGQLRHDLDLLFGGEE